MVVNEERLPDYNASLLFEGGIAFIVLPDGHRIKIGKIINFSPLTIEASFNLEQFDLSGNTPPKAIDLEV